ncbi:uncharacterized protein L201_003274 [Kwoniella dendrophila CBS 6074]|uniref:Membrane anchor Opy2 N-terminal domain-containing protein n=1 Tax=Kwoniella dendrophila CBS 6074 TaxID=1295534 RepID=A0AAX4JV13_9TREE
MHSSHNISPRLDLWKRDGCVSCDEATPQCNCAAGEKCILTSRTCNQCPTIQCIKSSSSKSKGVNPGAIAGPVVAVLVIASLGLFWWLRRKKRRDLARLESLAARARKAESAGFQLSQPPSPQPGSAHSMSTHSRDSLPQRPPSAARSRSPLPPAPVNAEYYDDHGATIRVYNSNRGTIDLDKNDNGDPFSDRQSISTMGSGGTANIIPIQYIPPSKSDEALSKKAIPGPEGPSNQSAAAKALDIARQNLLHPRRPARAPDLDLRLNPPSNSNAPPSAYSFLNDQRSPGGASSSQYRDSYLSGNSAAPSYWSGQSDVHLDAPKIVTSRQVQIGRLQQAEVVQFGANGKPNLTINGQISPDNENGEHLSPNILQGEQQRISPTSRSFHSGTSRTLTPISNRFNDNIEEEELEEGLRSNEPPSAGSDGDLRFSMGSLAYDRNSVSTMGTGRYLASAIQTGSPSSPLPHSQAVQRSPIPPPPSSKPLTNGENRNSKDSSKSFADSVLGSFPMIPPNFSHPDGGNNRSPLIPPSSSFGSGLPQSTSTNTLEHLAFTSRPSTTYKNSSPSPMKLDNNNNKKSRPETQASVADSFLGSFPFIQPSQEELNDLPSTTQTPNVPSNASARALSTTSEGLGGFEFMLQNDQDIPPVPTPRKD